MRYNLLNFLPDHLVPWPLFFSEIFLSIKGFLASVIVISGVWELSPCIPFSNRSLWRT